MKQPIDLIKEEEPSPNKTKSRKNEAKTMVGSQNGDSSDNDNSLIYKDNKQSDSQNDSYKRIKEA